MYEKETFIFFRNDLKMTQTSPDRIGFLIFSFKKFVGYIHRWQFIVSSFFANNVWIWITNLTYIYVTVLWRGQYSNKWRISRNRFQCRLDLTKIRRSFNEGRLVVEIWLIPLCSSLYHVYKPSPLLSFRWVSSLSFIELAWSIRNGSSSMSRDFCGE